MKLAKSPPPHGLPFALVEAGVRGLRLVALNAVAKSFGLSHGQRLADARAQVPDLLSELHEPEQDMASLLGLCRWMERFSPWVSPDMPDGILVDVSGIPHLFGGEPSMLNEMRDRLINYGFTASIAPASTIGAAWALARYGSGEEKLEPLPIEALRIDGEAARILRRLGLKTIGSLINIPRSSLARRFRGERIHENVLARLDEALGIRDEPLNPLNPPYSFMAHRALMEPLISTQGLESLLTGLVALLARDLEKQNQGALRLILKLFRTDGSRISLPAGLSSPSNDPSHIFRLLKPRLETIDAGFGIDAMTLEARETAPAIHQQYGFMEDTTLADFDRLNDRVMNRHEAAITNLISVESHIPERAETKSLKRPRKQSHVSSKTRPLLIFEHAEAASVIASVPDGPPMRFTWRKVTRRVLRSQGPERVAPEWWHLSENDCPRDYYIIEDEQGRRYWLYREGLYGETGEAQPKWFVHGLSA
jgi:protein ImuB